MALRNHPVADSQTIVNRVVYSFPVQLMFLLFKKNIILAVYWVLLFAFISGHFGEKWGAPYLFVDPEYMGHVDFWSFLIIGISMGGFIMAINMSSYVLNAFRFPFLATLSNPFGKFILNNSIIPLVFVGIYIGRFANFQLHYEFQPLLHVWGEITGFLLGLLSIVFGTILYFFYTNKDVKKLYGVQTAEKFDFTNSPTPKNTNFKARKLRIWRVDTYFSWPLRIKLVRGAAHYDRDSLTSVFKQNQLNAAIIQIVVFVVFLLLGMFRENTFFKIPAAASVVMLFSLIIMVISALRYWMRGWANVFFIVGFLLLNYTSGFEWFNPKNKAYGLKYDTRNAYSMASIGANINKENYDNDINETIAILNNWKARVSKDGEKPKLVLLNVSGGGLRAADWTFRCIQFCDSVTKGKFFEHTALITGASGGMIGAAYFRELYLQSQTDTLAAKHSLYSRHYGNNMGRDILNPIVFSIAVNDMFLRLQEFKINGVWHQKDRAYAFEKQLNENLHDAFKKTLNDYQAPEQQGLIPMMVFTPTIINDGRRLFISPQHISYLCNKQPISSFNYTPIPEGVEYSRFFERQDALSTLFTSVLRMNSTFPYIQPSVSLPTTPAIEVMDAGLLDNFGVRTSVKYMFSLRRWLEENTSGIIFVQIRDTPWEPAIADKTNKTILENLATPMDVFYGNFAKEHLYVQDELVNYASADYKGQLHFITIQLPAEQEKVSLSWHLTSREKKYMYNAIYTDDNRFAVKQLKNLLK